MNRLSAQTNRFDLLLLGAGSESKKDTIDEEEDDDDDDDDVPDLVENFDEASKNEEKAAEAKGKLLLPNNSSG